MGLGHPLQVVTPTVDGDVFVAFAGAETAFAAPQVHRLAGQHSESGVRRRLKRLAGQGIVRATRAGQAWLYELNRQHLRAPHVVALAEFRWALVDQIGEAIAAWPTPPEYAALFGSAAAGGMRPNSDIDLLVVRPDNLDPDDVTWRSPSVSSPLPWPPGPATTHKSSSGATEVAEAQRGQAERVLRASPRTGSPSSVPTGTSSASEAGADALETLRRRRPPWMSGQGAPVPRGGRAGRGAR